MAYYPLRYIRSGLARTLVRFCIVGGIGFAVNATILESLPHLLAVPFYIAQIVGAETALLTNFMLHDVWTFDGITTAPMSRRQRLLVYHGTFLLGMVVNSAITVFVHYRWGVPGLFALVTGSACALIVNFLTSKFIVWRSPSSS